MIVRKSEASADPEAEERAQHYGASERLRYSDAGGPTQFGAHVETLQPGSRSSERHWHEEEDEFLYVISGEATASEEDGAHPLGRGDAACWPAGAANAHQTGSPPGGRSPRPAPTSSSEPGWRTKPSITPTWGGSGTSKVGMAAAPQGRRRSDHGRGDRAGPSPCVVGVQGRSDAVAPITTADASAKACPTGFPHQSGRL